MTHLEDLDSKASKLIKKKLLAREPGLFSSKWFDYRFHHPFQATSLFLTHYVAAHREEMAVRVDMNDGWRSTGISNRLALDENQKAIITSLWSARQLADEHGVPYETFCRIFMSYATRAGWSYLPRPNQLYSDELVDVLADGIRRWREQGVTLAKHPSYLARNFSGLPDQLQYQGYLIDAVQRRLNQEFLAGTLLGNGHLLESVARERLGNDVVARALEVIDNYRLGACSK